MPSYSIPMPSDAPPQATPNRPSRAQRIAVAGFLFAFGLTLLTVLLTGLATKRHSDELAHAPPQAASGAVPEPAGDR